MHRLLVLLALLPVMACTDTISRRGHIGDAYGQQDIGVSYTTADLRMIEERTNPLTPNRRIVCTEPAPDVAKALSAAGQGTASGGDGAVQAQVGGGFASAEALLELAGRSTSLLGLRDGLFRACEAYANGAIGDAAYALVLSRYGQLMVALFLAQDIQNAAAAGQNTVSSPIVSANGAAAGSGTSTGKPAATTSAAKPATVSATMQSVSGLALAGEPGVLPHLLQTPYLPQPGAHSIQAPQAPEAGAAAAAPEQAGGSWLRVPQGFDVQLTPADAAAKPKAAAAAKPASPAAKPATAGPASGADTAADAIEKIATGYFDLGTPKYIPALLLVACIDEYDMTRPNAVAGAQNTFLRSACASLQSSLPRLLVATPAAATPARVRPGRRG